MDLSALANFLKEYSDVAIAIGSAVVAVISALIARSETRRQRLLQTEQLRQNIDAASLDWGREAIDTMVRSAMLARTRHLQANDAAFEAAKASMMIALSALVDRGRMFFPNLDPERKGAEKEGAYRGHRPPILNVLMWTYYEVQALVRAPGGAADSAGDFIDECRRLLVSELQAHLDPRRLDQVVGRYDRQAATQRAEAIEAARRLKTKLASRRPDIALDGVASPAPMPERAP